MANPTRPDPPRLSIPKHWTPAQAEAVHDFLMDVVQAVFEAYDVTLVDLARGDPASWPPDEPPYEPSDDDDIPF